MSDSRLDSFAERIIKANLLTADILCKEALRLFWSLSEKQLESIVVPMIGRSNVIDTGARGLSQYSMRQFSVEFCYNPEALRWKIDHFSEQYLRPAMSWLLQSIPEKSIWAEPSFELPEGVVDAAKNLLYGIELRCVISEVKATYSNIPPDWITIRSWYNISTDELERDVYVAPMLHFSVRTKLPLGPDGQ